MRLGPTVPSPRMLVVDDSAGTRHVLARWLRGAGFQVEEAATGAHALDLLSRGSFDLVLLDVHLPDMTGYEVCERIKANRATAAIPVLHVSATATASGDRVAGLSRGADGYLTEPIERDELLATVAALLRYHDARRTAERLATRLERLHQATLLMNAAGTISELSQVASSGLLSLFGATVGVFMARDEQGRVATAAPDQMVPVVQPCGADQIMELADAVQSAGPLDLNTVREFLPDAVAGAVLAAPLTTPRGELIGAVVLLGHASSTEDDLLLDHFAQALAVAMENQHLYLVEHRIALTLQRAMLPRVVPQPDNLEIAARYQAASDTVEIGGDFYEVLQLDGGITLLAIGDVVGHSLQAATVMAEVRYSLRAFAAVGRTPPQIIERLTTVLSESHPGLTATLCMVELDPGAGVARVTNAGHVPPVVWHAGTTRLIRDHGPLLGLLGGAAPPTVTVAFPPGAVLVLTTDGLLERRHEDFDQGLERLQVAIRSNPVSPAELCDVLIPGLTAGFQPVDDIAVLIARNCTAEPTQLGA